MNGKKILIATDGSASAHAAVELGLELARARGAGVVFLHVVPSRVAARLTGEQLERPLTQGELAERDPVLGELAELARAAGVAAELEAAGGETTAEVVDAIVGIAAGKEAELVVVGSRGHGALASTVLGSVSHGVLRYSDVPVVVARGAHAS